MAFLQASSVCLLAPGQKAASLFSLVLYNCLTYCLRYLHSLLTSYQALRLETITPSSPVTHLAMSATKLTLEWTKFVVFFMTAVSVGLALVLGVTLQGVSLTPTYLLLTSLYYISLEPGLVDLVARAGSQSHLVLQRCEGEELVCSSVLLKIISLLLSLIIITISLLNLKYKAGLTVLACAYLKVNEVLKQSILIIISVPRYQS